MKWKPIFTRGKYQEWEPNSLVSFTTSFGYKQTQQVTFNNLVLLDESCYYPMCCSIYMVHLPNHFHVN